MSAKKRIRQMESEDSEKVDDLVPENIKEPKPGPSGIKPTHGMSSNGKAGSSSVEEVPEVNASDIDQRRTKAKKPIDTIDKERHAKKYCITYENEQFFENWVKASSKGVAYAYCVICDCHFMITSREADLKRHYESNEHIVNARTMQSQSNSTDVVSIKFSDDVCMAELRLAAVIAEHDLPIDLADHLPQLIKAVCSDSKIGDKIAFDSTKAVSLINNVIGEENFLQLIKHLRKNSFSLIVDESTDKSCVKHLCMVARVLLEDSVNDIFLGLIPIEDTSVNTLYNQIVNFFSEHEIPYKKNMLGFAADGSNTMLGAHNSLSALLKKDIPHLFVMKFICHSFALCASSACLKLPPSIEDLARDIYSYFRCSPKRVREFEEFERFADVKPHKLLHPSQTRWLSLHIVVSALLEQYDALTLYFTNAALCDMLIAPEIILEKLNNPVTKLYLMFLDFVLPIFNNLNQQMQSESTQVHLLHNSVSSSLTTILECFLKESYIRTTPLMKVRFREPENIKPLEEIYLGIKVGIQLRNTDSYEICDLRNFRENCLEFLMEATSQIYQRFSFDSVEMESLKTLSPSVVIDRNVASPVDLLTCFEHFVSNTEHVDTEWRLLANSLGRLDLNPGMDPEEFWSKVASVRQVDGNYMFPNLSKFMQTLLCLPLSSATVERVFSYVNRMKTKSRNRLSTDSIAGFLHTKQFINGKSCFDFCITDSLLERAKSASHVQTVT